MAYKRLFIWVEGLDDVRFFDRIIKPIFEKKYTSVEVKPYAGLKREKVDKFLKSIKAMNANYIYVRDIDDVPCVTAKKQGIQGELSIDKDRIIVVIKEIESWYLAGLNTEDYKQFGIPPCNTTDNVAKEQFNRLIPKSFDSRIDFLQEILKGFSVEIAKRKNRSFKYFLEKHDC